MEAIEMFIVLREAGYHLVTPEDAARLQRLNEVTTHHAVWGDKAFDMLRYINRGNES
jgi:hypothetical protein